MSKAGGEPFESEHSIDDLYRRKGEAVTQIEIWQAKLQTINQKIIEQLNRRTEKSDQELDIR